MLRPTLMAILVPLLSVPATAQANRGTEPNLRQRQQSPQLLLDTRARIRRALGKHLAAAREGKLREIRVGDTTMSPDRVRREAVFALGEKIAAQKTTGLFIEKWKAIQIAAGRPARDFEIPAEAGEEPALTADIAERVRRAKARQQKLFDRVFMPGAPENWPAITREAIEGSVSDGRGGEFWKNVVTNARGGELPAFWLKIVREWVTRYLKGKADIRYPSDGLPDGVTLRVDDREWTTAEAFEQVRRQVHPHDLERALTTVVVREALRQELVKSGHWLGTDEFRKLFATYRREHDKGTPFTVEVIASAFLRFPSFEAYRHHWRLARSFEAMIAPEIDDARLAAHAAKRLRYLAGAATTVELIPFLARDPKTWTWRTDGFAAAQAAAIEAFGRLETGVNFDRIRTELGQFRPDDQSNGLHHKPLNGLRGALGEGNFTDVVLGFSLAEHLFFDAPIGVPVGPFPGPDGYYLAQVLDRGGIPAPPKGHVPTQLAVRQDYLHRRFCAWANEVLIRAVIR